MRRFVPLVGVLALCLGAPVAADEKADADLKAMVGKWKVEKAEMGGKDVTEHLKTTTLEIRDGGKYTAENSESKVEGSFTVDPSKLPKEMVLKPTGVIPEFQTVKAIYKLDGDTLTICYALDTKKATRPEKFESKPDTNLLLTTYKREKK